MPHPHLWPAIIGASLGMALIVWASIWLAQQWPALAQRKRWGIFIALALFEAVYWINIYAWFVEPRRIVVREVEIVSADWQGAPLRVVAIGDPHIGGAHINAARMMEIVRRANALRPDLVVLLGDYVIGHAPQDERTPAENQEITGGIATFAAFNARYGVVGVIGNHDSWYGRQAVTTALQDAGVAALWNRHIVISREGGDVVIAGLADDWTGDPDFAAALDGAPDGADTLVLSHSPDPFAEMPRTLPVMLAAHAHCGQVTLPLIGRPASVVRNRRYECHRVDENGHTLYVTAGVGTSGPPVRFLTPPEIVVVTIRGIRE